MAEFSTTYDLTPPVERVFAFLSDPLNLPTLIPPDVSLELIDAPTTLWAGSRLTWKARRWGIAQRIEMEVTAVDENRLLIQEQVKGPFARWVQTQRFEPAADGCRRTELVEFEPPGGMLGRVLTEAAVLADLERLYAYRGERLRALLVAR